jgi:hypothetical protein
MYRYFELLSEQACLRELGMVVAKLKNKKFKSKVPRWALH